MSIDHNDPLSIPPAVLNLNDVTASEKMLLALYAAEPHAINFRALKVLGVGLSGLKKIKRRLIDRGLLKSKASGYQTLVPGLTPQRDEGVGHLFSNSSAIENTNKVAPRPEAEATGAGAVAAVNPSETASGALQSAASAEQILRAYDSAFKCAQYAIDRGEGCHASTLLRVVEQTLNRVKSELPDGPERELLLAEFTTRHNAFFALNFGIQNLPRKFHRKLDLLIADSTPEQLAKLRVGIEQAQLAGGKPTLLLQQFWSDGK